MQDNPGAGFLRPASPANLPIASCPGPTLVLSTVSAAKTFVNSMQRSRTTNHQRFCNPKGIVSASPGLRGTNYPRWGPAAFPTPTGLRLVFTVWPQPRWGCLPLPRCPRVARSSHAWASGWNPFGIQFWNFGKASSGFPVTVFALCLEVSQAVVALASGTESSNPAAPTNAPRPFQIITTNRPPLPPTQFNP